MGLSKKQKLNCQNIYSYYYYSKIRLLFLLLINYIYVQIVIYSDFLITEFFLLLIF